MYGEGRYPEDIVSHRNNLESLQYTDEIFKAYVDAIIPRSPSLAEEYGRIQYYGALDLYTDEYLIYSLNYSAVPIADDVARMLEIAANYFLATEMQEGAIKLEAMELSDFGSLTPMDRLRVMSLLEQAGADIPGLSSLFASDQSYIQAVTYALNRLPLMGYYTEWSGYGTTRLLPPNQWVLEYEPISWEQVGYPGPSLGYRALRVSNAQSI